MKVLNLYACLGGNRLKWADYTCPCGNEFEFDLGKYGCSNCCGENTADLIEVTAVELDPELARMYQERFPNDTVIVADAHQYLLDHYKEFDFIWSSPPCPTHSRARFWNTKAVRVYPDFKLYEEIVFLKHHFPGKWVVENVTPYYEPLMNPTKHGRHLFWSNFSLPYLKNKGSNITEGKTDEWEKLHQVDLSSYKGHQRKDKILRNLVHYETGLHIFNLAKGIHIANNSNQTNLFE